MSWRVELHGAFDPEYDRLNEAVKDELLAKLRLVAEFGPALGRPHVDTLAGSRHANMKELRFRADRGVWRVAFAFDPERKAVVLVAGDKTGVAQGRFYKRLLETADQRYDEHLSRLGT